MTLCPDEQTVAQFVGGALPPEITAGVEAHIDRCGACQRLIAGLARLCATVDSSVERVRSEPNSGPLARIPLFERGDTVGRYVVLGDIGEGGMGMVVAAYDPELDRRVALKFLHSNLWREGGSAAGARLQREAQAMAQVSHPNIIAVHDVGRFGDEVFVAMEHAEGQTLEAWLAEERGWAEVLAVFEAAGQGLAAVHGAGLVHRDFKPGNVMISTDGRVRVLDFGIAALEGAAISSSVSGVGAPDFHSDVGAREPDPRATPRLTPRATPRLTRTGAVLGTPAYMAPEVIAGGAADARSDQYSFCVAFYEALFGVRPFGGSRPDELLRAARAQRLAAPKSGRDAPRWLRQVVARGLSAEPGERYPSMRAVLAALARRSRLRHPAVTAVGATLLMVAAGLGGWMVHRELAARSVCENAGDDVDQVWNGRRRQAMQSSFEATPRPYAGDAFGKVGERFDSYAAEWRTAVIGACSDTHIRHQQSSEMLDRRIACLRQHLDRMSALIDVLGTGASADMVDRSIDAVNHLPELDDCSAVNAGARNPSAVASPTAQQLPRVAAVEAVLDHADARQLAGDYAGALELAASAERGANEIDYAPLRARAAFVHALAERENGDWPGAGERFRAAARAAAESNDDELLTRARVELASILLEGGHYGEATELFAGAELALLRLHRPEHPLHAKLAHESAQLFARRGDYAEAEARLRLALELLAERYGPDDGRIAGVKTNLGIVLTDLGRYDEARAVLEEAWAARRRSLPAGHPELASTAVNLAGSLERAGEYAESERMVRQAFEILSAALGVENRRTAVVEVDLANALSHQGKLVEAHEHLQRAVAVLARVAGSESLQYAGALGDLGNISAQLGHLEEARKCLAETVAIRVRVDGDQHVSTAVAKGNLANVLLMMKDYEGAGSLFEQALAAREAAMGASHPGLGYPLVGLADARRRQGRCRDAAPLYARALALWQAALGNEHPLLVAPRAGLGLCALERGATGEAIRELEPVAALQEPAGIDPLMLGEARFGLARALWRAHRERKRARALARTAGETFAVLGAAGSDQRALVTRWLAGPF